MPIVFYTHTIDLILRHFGHAALIHKYLINLFYVLTCCPFHQGTARLMYNSFGSSLWLMPFSKHCKADNVYWKHFFEEGEGRRHTYHCDEIEFQTNYSGWPTEIINIELPSIRGVF